MNESQTTFVLAQGGKPCSVYIDETDYPAAVRAARLFAGDLEALTGSPPVLAVGGSQGAGPVLHGPRAVVAGTLGRGGLIDALAERGRIAAERIRGGRERYLRAVVEGPLPEPLAGVSSALVVAGSDRRGTVYGLLDLSAELGVSPWAWWADVPVQRRTDIVLNSPELVSRQPAVRYRGIFLNDEEPCLGVWAREKFGGLNAAFYEKVFELILRLGGNFLWPAMWGKSFFEDDPASLGLADEMGVVIGTSHHEPMCRAHDEWRRHGTGPWNYEKNKEVLRKFWREGYARSFGTEMVTTVGMRGDGDEPMSEEENVALLERIVSDQRAIIAEVSGGDPAEQPQAWAVYKEVQGYYDRGMRVPDDVTIVFADDNWGNMRRLPPRSETSRTGGYGMYYHLDYVGGPRCYKWIATTQISRIWEQMHEAYEAGVDRLWILNVGDLKPYEYSIDFFLRLARDADIFDVSALERFPKNWAAQQFGEEYAQEIGSILEDYARLSSRRKPELLSEECYSLVDYREAERVQSELSELLERAERVGRNLPAECADAYYQLVLHPARALENIHALYFARGRNALYAAQGRSSAEKQADLAALRFEKDAEFSRFYNEDLSGGKWRHMMDQTHIGYGYWRDPPRNVPPPRIVVEAPKEAAMGVAIEGSSSSWPGGRKNASLPTLDPYAGRERWIEVFNRGRSPFSFKASPSAPYLCVEPSEGEIGGDTRLRVSVEWSEAPEGFSCPRIEIAGSEGTIVQVMVPIDKYAALSAPEGGGFVEGDGCVAIEAEHFARAVGGSGLSWTSVPRLGRTLSAMTVFPIPARKLAGGTGAASTNSAGTQADAPYLEYRLWLRRDCEVQVEVLVSPPQDLFATGGMRYSIAFDDESPKVRKLNGESDGEEWEISVSDNAARGITNHGPLKSGWHTLRYTAVDPALPLQRIIVWTRPRRSSYLGPPESFFMR
jgi:hypothetical protein